MVKLTPKIIIVRILVVGGLIALFAGVAIYYKNTIFAGTI